MSISGMFPIYDFAVLLIEQLPLKMGQIHMWCLIIPKRENIVTVMLSKCQTIFKTQVFNF